VLKTSVTTVLMAHASRSNVCVLQPARANVNTCTREANVATITGEVIGTLQRVPMQNFMDDLQQVVTVLLPNERTATEGPSWRSDSQYAEAY
jgi:hypothetical protein